MPSILVVDDTPAIVRMLHNVLTAAGYEVTPAPDAETAAELCLEQAFDLIVSDINLPGMSGCDLARLLAERRPGTRVLLISGYETNCADCPHTPPCTVLRKPFSLRALLEAVERKLNPEG